MRHDWRRALVRLTVEERGDQVRISVRVGDCSHVALLDYDDMLALMPALFEWCVDRMIARRRG